MGMTLGRLDFLYSQAIELPPGAAVTFRTPGGLRMARYEHTRTFVIDTFRGRRDF